MTRCLLANERGYEGCNGETLPLAALSARDILPASIEEARALLWKTAAVFRKHRAIERADRREIGKFPRSHGTEGIVFYLCRWG